MYISAFHERFLQSSLNLVKGQEISTGNCGVFNSFKNKRENVPNFCYRHKIYALYYVKLPLISIIMCVKFQHFLGARAEIREKNHSIFGRI